VHIAHDKLVNGANEDGFDLSPGAPPDAGVGHLRGAVIGAHANMALR
jgi:hypothetical protein